VAPGVPCTCGVTGCLFDLKQDPNEVHDVAASHPKVVARLRRRLDELRQSVYAPDRGAIEPAACEVITERYHGFWGPWQGI